LNLKTLFIIHTSYTVGVYIFTCALGSLLWAPYAGFCLSSFLTCTPHHLIHRFLPEQMVANLFTWPPFHLFVLDHYAPRYQQPLHNSSFVVSSKALVSHGMSRALRIPSTSSSYLWGPSVLSVGAATISDIYRLEERGTAMGVFFGVCKNFTDEI
jgi:hypothetical protein